MAVSQTIQEKMLEEAYSATPNYDIDPNDKRFTDVNEQKDAALKELDATYAGMIGQTNQYYDDQIAALDKWEDEQTKIQNAQTDFTIQQIEQQKPDVVVIDSIQTIYTQTIESSAGSVSQIRECAASLLKYAKTTGTSIFIIGHITKDGTIAGPKILEHIVDVVLQFEGDGNNVYRILRGIKNRFGATFEIGVFEMLDNGLRAVENPSEILLSHYEEPLSGIAVGASVDGVRPYLIEVQALVTNAAYGTPQRNATGYDSRRMSMLLAVLEKRVGMKMFQKDVFLNFAGGFRVADTGLDLSIVSAVISSYYDRAVLDGVCCAGEVGLSGEVRPAPRSEQRISEAARLGFRRIIVSGFLRKNIKAPKGIEIVYINNIGELPPALFTENM